MKPVIFIIAIFTFVFSTAQTANPSKPYKPGITPQELERSKQLYDKMMESETYKLQDKGSKLIAKKLKGVNVFPDMKEAIQWGNDSINNYIYAQIEKNLPQTGFASVAEAKELMEASTALMKKQIDENSELYNCMMDATSEQLREILERMFRAKREELFGPRDD